MAIVKIKVKVNIRVKVWFGSTTASNVKKKKLWGNIGIQKMSVNSCLWSLLRSKLQSRFMSMSGLKPGSVLPLPPPSIS